MSLVKSETDKKVEKIMENPFFNRKQEDFIKRFEKVLNFAVENEDHDTKSAKTEDEYLCNKRCNFRYYLYYMPDMRIELKEARKCDLLIWYVIKRELNSANRHIKQLENYMYDIHFNMDTKDLINKYNECLEDWKKRAKILNYFNTNFYTY